MTAAINQAQVPLPTSMPISRAPVHESLQLDLPSVLPSTTALHAYPLAHTVDHASATSVMTDDRHDLALPLYSVPPAVSAVTWGIDVERPMA